MATGAGRKDQDAVKQGVDGAAITEYRCTVLHEAAEGGHKVMV